MEFHAKATQNGARLLAVEPAIWKTLFIPYASFGLGPSN